MDSFSSNAEQAVSFDFLVKVTGDKLELQHDLLQSLLVPYKDIEVPLAIVTVIGQPKSRKTLLTNLIQNCIIRLVETESTKLATAVTPTSGFPRCLDDCPSKSIQDKLDGQQGILIWTTPCLVQQEDGQPLAVFILDIWSENPSPSIYTKLVDFCIASSSVVILVEDCCVSKESSWNQWDLSKSFLYQVVHLEGWEFQNLHVLIHANWEEENFQTLGFEGGNVFMNVSTNQFSERLSRVIDTVHILKPYFAVTSYFLEPFKQESNQHSHKICRMDCDHIRDFVKFSYKVVGCRSKLFPLVRNKTVVSTLSVKSHIQNGIVLSNSVAAVTEATDATTSQRNSIEVAMELCEDIKGSWELPTTNEVASNKSSRHTPTNFEARAEGIENQYSIIDAACVTSYMKVADSFEDSTNSNSQSDLDKIEANQQSSDVSEIHGFITFVKKSAETTFVSHSSVLRSVVDDTGKEAMDQTETPVKPLETSKVPLLELKHREHLLEAYKIKLRTVMDNSSETELFFKDEVLETLHLQFKSQAWEDFSSQFPSSQDAGFHETMNNECDKIFTDFKQENSESRRLYYLRLQEGEKNSKLKFDKVVAKLRIQVLKNPLEILYDLRNDDFYSYYEEFTRYENLSVKWKNYFTSWYSCKSDEFKADFDFMKTLIKSYQENLQRVLISSTFKTKNEFEEAHVMYSENANEMAINRKWSHRPLNDIAKEAIFLIKKTFSRCIDLTNDAQEVYEKGLKAFIDSQSNSDTLYFEDDQLKSVHSNLKAEIEKYDVISRIPPSLIDVVLPRMKTNCDEIFSDFMTKYSEERTSFYNFHQQVKFNTTRKFDEEVAKLELQVKKDPSNLSYDLKMANLDNYVKILAQNVPDSKWRNYFISWYSHELDDFMKDVHAMIAAIRLYRDKLKTFFNEKVCVHENKFHEPHSTFAGLTEGDISHTWKNNRLKVLSTIGIELTKQSFIQVNSGIIKKEEKIANEASIFAEEFYNNLMKSKISGRTFTDSEVSTFHEVCVKASLGTFLEVPEYKSSFVWTGCVKELKDRLHIQLPIYLKENQQNVDRAQRTKANFMIECTQVYNDSMNKLIADRVSSDKLLRAHHNRSTKEAIQILNERMDSSEEKFDKSSWGKELEEKLRVFFNAFTGENNRNSENNARNDHAAAAATVDYGNVARNESCGVGIYFGPDIIRIGTYANAQTSPKCLHFSPFITFEGNEIVFFNRYSCHHDHFDVYQTLLEEENSRRTVFISGKSYQLWTEEIVAVFLNKIKLEAETKFGFAITSCTVAVSAFMSTSSKHMLKTALTLAGFERNTIIQSTTAAGLSYVVTNKVYGNGPAIFIHQAAGSVFDVAIAVISQTSISVRNISGLPYLEESAGYLSNFLGTTDSQDPLSGKVKKLINTTIASSKFFAWQLEAVVMVHGEENFITDRSAITEPLLCHSLNTLDEAQGIVLGAAAFNAFQNKIQGAPNLEYNEVFPYTLIADINGQQIAEVLGRNSSVTSRNMCTRLPVTVESNSEKVRITEFAVEKEKRWLVGEYTINAVNSNGRNFFLFVNFNYEGLIKVIAKTADLKTFPLEIRTQGVTTAQQYFAAENLRAILFQAAASKVCLSRNVSEQTERKQEVKTNAEAETLRKEITSQGVVAPIEQDAKAKLVNLITDVKDRLAKSTSTNPMIVTRINERINECEELLEKDDVKEKQIEMQIKLLDLAAAKIK